MKLFIYKTLFAILCLYVLFEFTINAQIRKFESKIENLKSKETLYLIEKKIRGEMKSAVNKDKILSFINNNIPVSVLSSILVTGSNNITLTSNNFKSATGSTSGYCV